MTTEIVNDSIGTAAIVPAEASSAGREPFDQFVSRMSTRLAIPAGLVLGLLVLLLNTDRNPIPLSDDLRSFGTIGFFALLPLTAITSGWGYILGIRAWNERVGAERQRRWYFAFIPVALAYTIFAGGIAFGLISILEYAFRGLALSSVQSALLVGIGGAALTTWVISNVMKVDTSRLLTLVVILLASGVYLTLITIDDPEWWRVSFSYLGKMESNVNWLFNETLIFSGILLLIWRTYLMSDYEILLRHGIASPNWSALPRYGLIWVGIAIMIVGIFKSQLTPFSSLMHNVAAYSLAGVFGIFMVASHWVVPGFPREFLATSSVVVAVLVGTIVWAIIGGVNTVGLEMTVFVLGLMWLSAFANTTENLAREKEPESFAK